MIYSKDLEQKVLKGLLQHQDEWYQVSDKLTERDFDGESQVHPTIFKMLRNSLNNGEKIDDTILIERINQLKISFPDSIDLPEYIQNLSTFPISKEIFIASIRELKKFTIRRELLEKERKTIDFLKKPDPNLSYSQIIEEVDKLHNHAINSFELGDSKIVNLADIAEELVEDRGNNPPTEVGLMSPYPSINKIYGSLLRNGNITTIAARAKSGKSSWVIDFLLKVSYKYKVPILHFDNGEMSEEELVFRMVSGVSGVPMHLLESGKWRTHGWKDWSAKEVVERVRAVWAKMKGIKILYQNVAGMSVDEMTALLKRIYYAEVGRGNQMIFSFDYIKTDFTNLGKGSEWNFVGKLVHGFKQCISRELKFDGKPCVSMVTAVQTNRSGIVTGKSTDTVVDDESVVALSDSIIQFTSHLFLLRKKTLDELVDDGEQFGTHKLICLAARHLGEDAFGHLNPVEMPDGSKKNNFINLEFDNFNVTDKGDLRDIVAYRNHEDVQVKRDENNTDIPDYLQ